MKKNFLALAVTLSLVSSSSAVWATNTGGTANTPNTDDYAGQVVTGATGAVSGATVTIDTAVSGNVYGGYISNSSNADSASNNTVTVTGGVTIGRTLNGGETTGTGAADNNVVRINGDIGNNVSGGKTKGNTANHNKIYMTGGTLAAGVIGGESGDNSHKEAVANYNEIYITATDQATVINFSGNSYVIGGKSRHTAEGNKIIVGSDADQYDITMTNQRVIAGNASQKSINNSVIVGSANGTKAITLGSAYGAWVNGNAEGNYGAGNSVLIQNANTTISDEAYGAYALGKLASLNNNSVVVKDGNFATKCRIIGAYGEGSDKVLEGNSVDISGGTFADKGLIIGGLVLPMGGSGGNAIVRENSVRIKNVTIPDSVEGGIYGGYSKGTGDIERNEVIVDEDATKSTTINVLIAGGVNESAGTANLIENKVTINGGTINKAIMGGYTEGSGHATGNSVTLNGGTFKKEIYGGYTASGNATNNEININGNASTKPTFANDLVLYGGFSNNGGTVTGNKLNLYTKGISVGDIKNFDVYNFYLQEDIANNDTILTLKNSNGLDLTGSTVNIGVLGSAPTLQVDEKITLIKNENSTITEGDVTYGKLQQGVSIVYDFETLLENSDHDLVARVTGIAKGTTEQSKSPVETQVASIGFVNSGSDLLIDKGIVNAVRVAAVGEKNNPIFGAANAGKMRYKSGSHADITGYNIVLGTAKTVDNSAGKLTYGPFVEGGWGNYTSHLDSGVRGDGNTKYYGLGLFARQDNKNGMYYEGSARYGRLEADYASANMTGGSGSEVFSSYDSSSTYYGAHLGLGKISTLNATTKADVYAKLFYTHQNGDSVVLGGSGNGEIYDFDNVDSVRARIGGRLSKAYNERGTGYIGAGYEYEFDGEARATVKGLSTPSPSIKGSSALLEIGYIIDPAIGSDAPTIDLSLQGWGGKKQGILANMNFVWKF